MTDEVIAVQSEPAETAIPPLFEGRIRRNSEGLTVHLRSEILESVFKSLSGGRAQSFSWSEGATEGPGVVRVHDAYAAWAVKTNRLASVAPGLFTSLNSGLYAEGGACVNIVPLLLKGLGTGITIRPEVPYPADELRRYSKSLTDLVNRLMSSVQPVEITIAVKGKAPSAGG